MTNFHTLSNMSQIAASIAMSRIAVPIAPSRGIDNAVLGASLYAAILRAQSTHDR